MKEKVKAVLSEMGRRVEEGEMRRKLMGIGQGMKLVTGQKRDHKL